MANPYVAMYAPEEGNYEHWALYLKNGSEHIIYEVIGESPSFEPHVFPARPESTKRHKRSIFIAEIRAQDLPDFRQAVAAVKTTSQPYHWNCQDYVLEVLEQLEEDCVVNNEDVEYQEAKEEVKSHFGAML